MKHNIQVRFPQLIIASFVLVMILLTAFLQMDISAMLSNSLTRLVMNGVLVLALIPMLNTGVGINYGLSIGITAGLLGMAFSINFYGTGWTGFLGALALSCVFAVPLGIGYAKFLNIAKGNEDIAATFLGYSFTYIMHLFWGLFPFQNREMLWPIGGNGTRQTISLENYFEGVLESWMSVEINGLILPIGLLLVYALFLALIYWFFRTVLGKKMLAVGENECFAQINGININRMRAYSVILSTCLGALGICVYAQSYGFVELYAAPQSMVFPAVSSILIGGSTGRATGVIHAVLGTYLFQTIYILSTPLANRLLVPEFAEILRGLITNSVILYALLYQRRRRK